MANIQRADEPAPKPGNGGPSDLTDASPELKSAKLPADHFGLATSGTSIHPPGPVCVRTYSWMPSPLTLVAPNAALPIRL